MIVAFDADVLTLVLNKRASGPLDPATNLPVEHPRERVESLIAALHNERRRIVIPTPVLSEVLVEAGSAGLEYVKILQKQLVFSIESFGTLAAIELAEMTRDAIAGGDKKSGEDAPWQKIKIDRQIVAICKVAGVHTIYTSDRSLGNFAKRAGFVVAGVHDLPLSPGGTQFRMDDIEGFYGPRGETDDPKPEDIEEAEAEEGRRGQEPG